MKFTDEQYVAAYDKNGAAYYHKGNDAQLAKWGNSPERIIEIKIESVKQELKFAKDRINTYKILNKMSGGGTAKEVESILKRHRRQIVKQIQKMSYFGADVHQLAFTQARTKALSILENWNKP